MRTCVRSSVRVSLFGAVVCSDSVTVSGAEETLQSARMGTYLKVAGLAQGSRPVYQRVSSTTVVYLYYWPSSSSWHIGSNYTTGILSLQSASTAACPDQATGWQVWNGGAWVSELPVKVVQGVRMIFIANIILTILSCAVLSSE
jgi:hypothetical protein